jgi:hypothetical protein
VPLKVIKQQESVDGKNGLQLQSSQTGTFSVTSSNTARCDGQPQQHRPGHCDQQPDVTVTPQGQGSADITFAVTQNNSSVAGCQHGRLHREHQRCRGGSGAIVPAGNNAPTVSTAAADASGNEGGTLSTNGAFADQDGDALTISRFAAWHCHTGRRWRLGRELERTTT